jgi:hypothetical protein
MHHILALITYSLLAAAGTLLAAVVVCARIHKAKMRKANPWYSPFPEFALEDYYASQENQECTPDHKPSALRAA